MDGRSGNAALRPEFKIRKRLDRLTVPPNLIPAGTRRITPEMLPLVTLEPEQIETIIQEVPGGGGNIQDVYPLTPLQEGMLFHHMMDGTSDTYIVVSLLKFESRGHLTSFIDALQRVIDRHDILRTAFFWERLPKPVQVVYRQASLPVEELQLDRTRDLMEQLKERMRPDLQTLQLQRAPLIQLEVSPDGQSAHWYALLKFHHLVCDGQSMGVVAGEVEAHIEGRAQSLPEPMQYRQHVAQTLAQARIDDAEVFFRKKLGQVYETTAPFGLVDVHGSGNRVDTTRQMLEPGLARRLRVQARRQRVSTSAIFHAAWSLVIARTSGRDDVVFGTVLFGRLRMSGETRQRVGLFLNTLPLRLKLRETSATDLVLQTHQALLESLNYEQASLAVAQRCSGIARSAPLFTTLLNCRHGHPTSELWTNDAQGYRELAAWGWTNYPITLSIDDLGEDFLLTSQTDRRISSQRMTEYTSVALRSLVEALEHAPQTRALELAILPDGERHQVLQAFNTAPAPNPQATLIHKLFEEQVKRTPDSVAAMFEGASLTYVELNGRANQLARHLRAKKVDTDQLVGLCVERSLEMVIGLLGILKAGGAYLPLDPSYPAERMEYMLGDSAPRILLTQENLRERLPQSDSEVITLDEQWNEIARHANGNLDPRASGLSPHHLAYVIYTSGSTGKPKGVMVEHRNVTRLFESTDSWFRFNQRDVWTLFHSFAFDFSVWELWGALLYGGRLVVVPRLTARSPQDFYQLLCVEGVTVLNQTPSAFAQLIDAQAQCPQKRHSLRVVIFGGEALELRTLRPWVERNGAARPQLVNMYGITETTVHVTYRALTGQDIESERGSVIGKPIPDLRAYLLDEYRQPVPIGVVGEIYVGGAGVARGYLNRLELTSERFIGDPFNTGPQARLYKTGDLGKWRADGSIEYLGRNDSQVKIRGFRIELGEIEEELRKHPEVKEAVVLAREDEPGEKRLVAYVVINRNLAGNGTPDPVLGELHKGIVSEGASLCEETWGNDYRTVGQQLIPKLREYLKGRLPEHMTPSAWVTLKQLPLSSNGKLDRRALPSPQSRPEEIGDYVAPRTDLERTLADIWAQVLRIDQVGVYDNFFELGGHSLLIVTMMARLGRIGLSAPLRSVYESPTLAHLAGMLTDGNTEQVAVPPNMIPPNCGAITPSMLPLVELDDEQIARIVETVPGGAQNIQDIYPLVPLQEGILFHHLLREHGADVYARPILLSVSSREKLYALEGAMQLVIDRHDILRTALLWERLPRPVQVVYRRAKLSVEEIHLRHDRNAAEQLEERMESGRLELDLRQAPLMRFQIAADMQSGRWYALLLTHHLVFDNQSLQLLLSELVAYTDGYAEGLLEPVAYRNYVAQALAYGCKHDAEGFFRAKLKGIDEPTAPFGILEVHKDPGQVKEARHTLNASLAKRAQSQARRMSVSLATLFHAAWALVISHTSGRDDVVFGTVLSGRQHGSAETHRILGMFINTLPLRLKLEGLTARGLVEQTQRELVELLEHEQASLAVVQRCSSIKGSAPLFTTLLNYLHDTTVSGAQPQGRPSAVEIIAGRGRTGYPVALSVFEQKGGFVLHMETERQIDPHRITEYVATAIQSLVEALEKAPQTPALTLGILSQREQYKALKLFNETARAYPRDMLIQELFEEQVERSPDTVAIVYERWSLTYAELNAKANQLARHLRSRGIGVDQRVGICMERSLEMVIGLLGILKSGGAYVPLDPAYPPERLTYMLGDAAPGVLLIQGRLRKRLPETGAEVIALDERCSEIDCQETCDLGSEGPQLYPKHLAYVIYTSGSTGQPKGAMNEHRGVVNRLLWMQESYRLTSEDRVLQKTPFSFDVSVWEFFWTLINGARLILARPEGHKDPIYLRRLIEESGITRLHFVPSMLQSFLDQENAGGCSSLRHIVCSGEELPAALQSKCLETLPQARLSNLYGPTEAAVDVTAWECRPEDSSSRVPIGRPIANIQMYVLGRWHQPVPIGVPGELYIGGVGVGRGYLNRPGLTSERFVADPFCDEVNARLYKTGDLGLWRSDGTIEYLGRNDHQVKIRGFRIELGEIEAQLLRHPHVTKAVVLAREDAPGEKRLVGYVVARETSLTAEELRTHLKGTLPEYMVPGGFVVLESLPLTANGKLDRQALPAPELSAYTSRQHEAPQGKVEQILAGIWCELLKIEQVGRHDNFFDLGGHSLSGLKLIGRVAEALAIQAPVMTIFQYPTLLEMAQLFQKLASSGGKSLLTDAPSYVELDEGII